MESIFLKRPPATILKVTKQKNDDQSTRLILIVASHCICIPAAALALTERKFQNSLCISSLQRSLEWGIQRGSGAGGPVGGNGWEGRGGQGMIADISWGLSARNAVCLVVC